jgi:hypothetical protein
MEWEKPVSDRSLLAPRNMTFEWIRLGLMLSPSGFVALWLMGMSLAPPGVVQRILIDGFFPGLVVVSLGAAVCDGWISGIQGRAMRWPGVVLRSLRFLGYQLVVLPVIGGIMAAVGGVGYV